MSQLEVRLKAKQIFQNKYDKQIFRFRMVSGKLNLLLPFIYLSRSPAVSQRSTGIASSAPRLYADFINWNDEITPPDGLPIMQGK